MPAPAPQPSASRLLPRAEWRELRADHLRRVEALADAFVGRRSRGLKHPVHDFLFTYYSFSPGKLKQWTPAWPLALEAGPEDVAEMPWLDQQPLGLRGDTACWIEEPPQAKRNLAAWVARLCGNVQDRPPRFRCYGLHEWAMVYRQSREQIRHQGYELRMAPEELARFVESQSLCCSHYDAFRFFTPEARPLNAFQPVLETRLEMEQSACLHAGMDLYKWAAKLWPWAGSGLVGRCFELACAARDLDMRASPYDLAHLGYAPVRIETPEGREQYEAEQRALAARAAPLREQLRLAALRLAEA